jgi:primosomal protein N' (replication factor Y)
MADDEPSPGARSEETRRVERAPRFVRVAVAAPLPSLFDYLPPPGLLDRAPERGRLDPGVRVLVPFGRGRRVGIVVAMSAETTLAADRLRPVEQVLDRQPLLTAKDLRFILWAADYYRCSPGEALFTALPARLRRPEPVIDTDPAGWRIRDAADRDDEEAERLRRRAPRQAAVLELLREHPAGLGDAELRARLGDCAAALRALAAKGLTERCRLRAPAGGAGPGRTDIGPALNADQQGAVQAVLGQRGFGCFLLDGVTGSGKTEVYLRLIDDSLRRGRQVLVLVPEIGLTPQLRNRFAARITAPIAVLHSALGERERELAWHQAATGRARVVLGTRSAVLAPLPHLGLIIVDEEHDPSSQAAPPGRRRRGPADTDRRHPRAAARDRAQPRPAHTHGAGDQRRQPGAAVPEPARLLASTDLPRLRLGQ